ncbi:MAG: FtsX-like permease family protein, partial [Bryobacterales bacterium]|nr:FtsX-like permease family protein [Bryobacterales bacterium]
RVFGDESPIGKRFRRSGPPGEPNTLPWSTIVGVVGHVRNESLEIDPRSQAYWPQTQRTQDRAALVVRTQGPPANYAKAIVAQIRAENADQPVYDILTMEEWIGRTLQTRTLTTSLVSLFGLASLSLACLGLYGVISYAAALRLREFGIRLALGATSAAVRGLVLRKAGRLAITGTGIGLVLCWPASQGLHAFLYGIGALDAIAWTAAPLALIAVALLAALGPALRASHADPAQTLRAE